MLLLNNIIQEILSEGEVRKTLVEVVGGIPIKGSVDFFGDLMERQREAAARCSASSG